MAIESTKLTYFCQSSFFNSIRWYMVSIPLTSIEITLQNYSSKNIHNFSQRTPPPELESQHSSPDMDLSTNPFKRPMNALQKQWYRILIARKLGYGSPRQLEIEEDT